MLFDNHELALAHHMADVAGEIIRHYWRAPIDMVRKEDASPVTHADREVESAMRALIEAKFPEHGIIGEEHGNLNPDAEYQWVLDPIDGTRSFIAGYPIFTTLIALTRKGQAILGIINQPITGERWWGVADEQTLCNERPVFTRDTRSLDATVLATTSTYFFTGKDIAAFEKLKSSVATFQLGGDSYAYAMVASGQLDLVVDVNMKSYDYAALIPVIEGAGGIITDWSGKPLTLVSDGRVIAAASKELHEAALAILK